MGIQIWALEGRFPRATGIVAKLREIPLNARERLRDSGLGI